MLLPDLKREDVMSQCKKRLGYRLKLLAGWYPNNATVGSSFFVRISLVKTGFAASFNERKVYLVLRSLSTNQNYQFILDTGLRFC